MRYSRAGMGTRTDSRATQSVAGRPQLWQDERGPGDSARGQDSQEAKTCGGVSALTRERESP